MICFCARLEPADKAGGYIDEKLHYLQMTFVLGADFSTSIGVTP